MRVRAPAALAGWEASMGGMGEVANSQEANSGNRASSSVSTIQRCVPKRLRNTVEKRTTPSTPQA